MTDTPSHLLNLNPEQLEAVTTIDGPLLILAGAGSGKTRVLTRRIAHLLHVGVDPRNVLAVTFTNKAAAEMKERVVELVGDSGARVWVSTFHSTCGRILRRDVEALGERSRRFSIWDDDDQIRLVREIIKEHGYDIEVVPPKQVLARIDWYKCRSLTPAEVVRQRRSHVNDRVLRIWRDYEDRLRAADAIDFNDLIGLAVRLFRDHPDVLAKWRDRFRYVLVDEYQDTNQSQYDFLHHLTAEHHNLAVVGDDDQSIYGFRGADVSIILNFERDHPTAKVIRLEQNYRSTKNILEVANHVVRSNNERIDKRLWTDGEPGAPVNFLPSADQREEARRVVRAIHALRNRGLRWQDFAIIYRTNRMSRSFEQELRSHRMPYRVVGGRKFYERREVRDVVAYLRLLVNPADDAAFMRIVNVPSRGIGTKTLARLREDASTRGEPLLYAARAAARGQDRAAKALATFLVLIDELISLATDVPPHALVSTLLERSGYLAMLQAEQDGEARLDNLNELIREASLTASDPVATPLDRLQSWLDRMTLAGADEELPDGGEITLMTVHSSKGLEYPVVFVVHMNEGLFPHSRSLDDGIDEERRLAYVAFTRARTHLFVAYSMRRSDPGSPRKQELTVSRFIADLPGSACHNPPSVQPALATSSTALQGGHGRLKAFLENHARRADPPAGEEEEAITVVDLEDPSQLRVGTRVVHERHGLGTVRRVSGRGLASHVLVSFRDRAPMSVPLMGGGLQIVVD